MACGVFVGLSTIDLVYALGEFPQADSKSVATSQQVLVGGPATNAAITFSHLGGKAILITAVGKHTLAALIKEELERYSVTHIDLIHDSHELPPVSSVWVNRHGQRSVVSVNATHFKMPRSKIDQSIAENAAVVLVDAHCMDACQAWASVGRRRGIPVVLDGGSWKAGTDELLKNVDTAICSADFHPPGCSNEDAVLGYLRAAGVRQIAITRGASPLRFIAGSSAGFIEVVDTAGAGDIFHGAFCYYVSAGCAFADALREAAAVAAESCRFPGTRQWMSRR